EPPAFRKMVEDSAVRFFGFGIPTTLRAAHPKALLAMIGEKLGHYHLAAKIGEGGMGVVYRARDEQLNRDVAVKILAAGMLEQLGKDHLLREAQTASALSHTNICTIYQVG